MKMDVVSYRGPGAAGGVSSAIEVGWRTQSRVQSHWWYLSKNNIDRLSSHYYSGMFITTLSDDLIAGHYRYCNNFLWPIMHDLPQHATADEADRQLYREFNIRFADEISRRHHGGTKYFVQDYQLAIVPRFLRLPGAASEVFWHIPWPKNVPAKYIGHIAEIARSLLRANVIGFHSAQYAQNFLNFAWQYLPDYAADATSQSINRLHVDHRDFHTIEQSLTEPYHMSSKTAHVTERYSTRVVVQPLGIDLDHWHKLAEHPTEVTLPPSVTPRFVLSVDRVDYTKSVAERLNLVDRFFSRFPELQGQITFVQVCGRTRPGLAEFDSYWERCRNLHEQVNEKWRKDTWVPVHWIDKPLSAAQLASLYQRATIMLVNPVRDGLNLTAKEFVACQSVDHPGVLLLSSGAGAWHELKEYALDAHPSNIDSMIESMIAALRMGLLEKKLRLDLLKERVRENPLDQWWSLFCQLAQDRQLQQAPTKSSAAATQRYSFITK